MPPVNILNSGPAFLEKKELKNIQLNDFSESDLQNIEISGAREHNLKNIHLSIPRNKLVVITGLSGSGKSSLAFDTIYAEGQRRYIETFSAYARQFLGAMERPDVDNITGLSPVIAIDQKTVNKNPRSTVGTVTEIYDFLRLLFSKASDAYSYNTGEKMIRHSDEQIVNLILKNYSGKKISMIAPVIKARKGHYRELFEQFIKQGFLKVRVDGEIKNLVQRMQLDRYKIHDIEIVVDRIEIPHFSLPQDPTNSDDSKVAEKKMDKLNGNKNERENAPTIKRISESLKTAMKFGKGTVMILSSAQEEGNKINDSFKRNSLNPEGNAKNKFSPGKEGPELAYFSRFLMCPTTGISYNEPEPNAFSFNSPYGACSHCNGLGEISEIDVDKIIPDKSLSIRRGGIAPIGEFKENWTFTQLEAIGGKFGFSLNTPLKEIPEEALNIILYGSEARFKGNEGKEIENGSLRGGNFFTFDFEGITNIIIKQYEENYNPSYAKWALGFMNKIPCPHCKGARLKKDSLFFKIDNKNISEVVNMGILPLQKWISTLEEKLSQKQISISKEILKEIKTRIQFLLDVGLDYLTLNRSSKSLSGGEAQRIRLATQIGSQLVGVLYILDEPSIGLHQRDNQRLIHSLKNLRDLGNSVIVVEHDKEMILSADHVIDIGPFAGIHGGRIIKSGPPAEFLDGNFLPAKKVDGVFSDGNGQGEESLTAQYLCGKKKIIIPQKRRKGTGKYLELNGARGHNLKMVDVKFPLGKLICVTGVSGSGKSSLINETLYPILSRHFYKSDKKPLPFKSVSGLENIDKVIEIDQSPIGRTPRSNPATYTGVFTDIRNLYAIIPEAKIRGYKAGRFSFNVKGGRCETCGGGGLRQIEMNFLPDVYIHCETCNGKRYNRETLEVRYKGKSISDVLNMTIGQAVDFFENIPAILQKIKTLKEVGLGYITLGQSSTTLSGGEAQRVKLATELSKRDTGNTFYILDEPTTGLHFEDISVLMEVLNKLVEHGNTVLVIEHNMDVIKMADHIFDIGPEGGENGGKIICEGTPEEIAKNKISHTGFYLKQELTLSRES